MEVMTLLSRNQSERIRNEAVRLMREREDKTVMTQRDSDRRIGERLHDEVGLFPGLICLAGSH
jgi:hypothetical protein